MNDLRQSYSKGRRSLLAVLPTGGGKTLTFNFMALGAKARGRRVLILVHRKELLLQASRSLLSMGVEHGLIAPGFHGEKNQVAVASIATLDQRLKKKQFSFDFVIIDECHHSGASSWARVISQFPQAHILGVTATPTRLDGKGLGVKAGGIFEEIIQGPQITDLIDQGYLVRPKVYSPPMEFDLSSVRKRGGDYDQNQLSEVMDKPSITGCAVEHYLKLCYNEPAIAFCSSIKHAEHVAQQFNEAGVRAATIHGKLDDSLRCKMIEGLASGAIKVLTSVDIISEGTDIPVVSAAILLRPTHSLGLYLQQVGRVLRTSPGKTRAVILDHVGNCFKHGLPDEIREWTLDGIERKTRERDEDDIKVKQCKSCFAVWQDGPQCPECGHINPLKPREVKEVKGSLKEITAEMLAERKQKNQEVGRAQSYEDLLKIEKQRGYKKGWAHIKWQLRQRRNFG